MSMTSVGKVAIKVAGAVLLVLGIVYGLFVVVFPSSKPPKEQEIIRKFYANRIEYERLRDMLSADKEVRGVYVRWGVATTKSGLPHSPSEVGFPVERYNQYRTVLTRVGSTKVFRVGEGDKQICISIWAVGFGGNTRHIADCWLPNEPVSQVSSLDRFYGSPKPRHDVYRRIDGDWYIWVD